MRVMVFVKATEATEKGASVTPEAMAATEKFGEELVKTGIVVHEGAGLMNSSLGKQIVFEGTSRTVIDGPFAETRELIAGYSIWEVKDMAEAVAWVKRSPNPMPGRSEIEIRPLGLMEQVEENVPPETTEIRYRLQEIPSGS
ncbi:MAG: YciI family protein [Aliidongia sp.]